ncbi:MAG: hypothetical protein GY940_20590 [bacterium]|nr:hypothetical protein [bacterium]
MLRRFQTWWNGKGKETNLRTEVPKTTKPPLRQNQAIGFATMAKTHEEWERATENTELVNEYIPRNETGQITEVDEQNNESRFIASEKTTGKTNVVDKTTEPKTVKIDENTRKSSVVDETTETNFIASDEMTSKMTANGKVSITEKQQTDSKTAACGRATVETAETKENETAPNTGKVTGAPEDDGNGKGKDLGGSKQKLQANATVSSFPYNKRTPTPVSSNGGVRVCGRKNATTYIPNIPCCRDGHEPQQTLVLPTHHRHRWYRTTQSLT